MSKKIISLIPDTIKSPINRVLFDNVFQKYFDSKKQNTSSFSVNVNRETYNIPQSDNIDSNISMYQPLVTIDNVEYGFYDILSLMQYQSFNIGLDTAFDNGMDIWASCKTHSLKLPLNMDKFVNYNNYCWVGSTLPNYVVIRNQVVQQKELDIYNARLINNQALVAILQAEITNNINTFDPNGGFDSTTYGFDDYNFDSQLISSTTTSGTNWEYNNKWVHKDDLEVGAQYQIAKMPIIEYSNKIELVKWLKISHAWKYRVSTLSEWQDVDFAPSYQEILIGQREQTILYSYEYINNNDKKIFFQSNTIPFVNGTQFVIDGSDVRWTVDGTIQTDISGLKYVSVLEDNFRYFRFSDTKQLVILEQYDVIDVNNTGLNSIVTVKGDLSSFIGASGTFTVLNFFNDFAQSYEYDSFVISSGNTLLTINSLSPQPTNDLNGRISSGILTSQGDEWIGFLNQWCYNGIKSSTVSNDVTEVSPTNIIIDKNTLGENVQILQLGMHLPNSDLLIKLFINNVPVYDIEYGNYDGITFSPITTLYGLINAIKLMNSITVTVPLQIKIEFGAKCVADVGKENLIVRVDTDQKILSNVCLMEFQPLNQKQTKFNTYPMFKQYTLSNTPILMDVPTSIINHKQDNNGIFVPELDKVIAVNQNNDFIFDIGICQNSQHTMFKIDGIYKHIWSNNITKTIEISQVDSSGYSPSSIHYDVTKVQYPTIPEYMYGNINNTTFENTTRSDLSKHFNNIISENNIPARVLDDVNYIDNTISNLNIFDTMFPYLVNVLTNNKRLDVVFDAHKQMRLSYLSIFLNQLFTTLSDVNFSNLTSWYTSIKQNILKYDALKIHDNQLNHPLTPAMYSKSFITLPYISSSFLMTHDGILVNYDKFKSLFVNKMKSHLLYSSTPLLAPIINDVYFDDDNFYKFNGVIWQQTDIQTIVLEILLLLETELYDMSVTINSPTINAVINTSHYDKVQTQLFLKFTESAQNKYPYSNRQQYDMSNAFTWNYLNIVDISNVTSPLVGIPMLSANHWGASYKEIYNNLFNTPYPNIEPWKIQGFTVKPTWWDLYYKDNTNTRLWNTLMWSNILSGIVPATRLLPNGITISTGSIGSCRMYNFVPVNTTSSIVGGVVSDGLLPPFRSTVDALTPNVLISNVNFIDLSKSNNAEDMYGYGTLSEWSWKEQITFSYDVFLSSIKTDPRNFFKMRNIQTIDNVSFKDAVLITPTNIRDGEINFAYEMYKKYGNFYNKLLNPQEFTDLDVSMCIMPGTYINKDNIFTDIVTRDNLSIVRKQNQFNILKPVTNFKISVQNIDSSKRSDLLHNCSFSINSVVSGISNVEIFPSMYSKMSLVDNVTATIDPVVYNQFITGTKITVTWDGYVPEGFVEQSDFYVIKRGSNNISLCRSIKELNTTNYIELPTDYPYDIYVGIISRQFGVLQRQIVSRDFNIYASNFNQPTKVDLPVVVNGIQELINFLNGYILRLNKDGIFETHFTSQNINEVYNRVENFQLSLEVLLATIYNDKTNRTLFFGNDYICDIFKTTIFVNTDKQLLSLAHDEQQRDLSLLFDMDNNNIPTSNLIVFRTNPIIIETGVNIGGAILNLTTSQDVVKLNNVSYGLSTKQYPTKLYVTCSTMSTIDGFVNIDGNLEYNFEELTKSFKNIYTTSKTIPHFKTLSQQQLGYQPLSNNSLYGLSDDGGFKLWKESLSQKGSYENLVPFDTGFQQSINAQQLINSYQYSFGDEFLYNLSTLDIVNKKYMKQNSVFDFNNFNTNIPLEYVNNYISSKVITAGNIENDNKFNVYNGNGYVLDLDFNISEPIVKFSIPRFTTSIMTYTILINTDISLVEVFINNEKKPFSFVKTSNSFTITCDVNDQITNDVVIILPTTSRKYVYQYSEPYNIDFDLDDVLVATSIQSSLLSRDIIQPRVLLSETTKAALKKFEYIDVNSGNIPYVDYINLNDPIVAMYNVVDNEEISTTTHRITQIIDKLWYKKSQWYKPYNNTYFGEEFCVANYNQSYLDDDGVYQLIDTDIEPATWHEIAESQETLLVNGIPSHNIQQRTRINTLSPWTSWTTINTQHQQVVTASISNNISVTIGEIGDIVNVFVNGIFHQLVFYGANINVDITNTLPINVIDLFIVPIIKDDSELIEYRRSYSFYTYRQNDSSRFVYWVKEFKNANTTNAYIANTEIKTNMTNTFGLVNNEIIIFNKDLRWKHPLLLIHNNKTTHDIWSQHTTSTNTTKMSKQLWEQIIKSSIDVYRNLQQASKDSVWITWVELISSINNILISNVDLVVPYSINDLLLDINTTYTKVNQLYDMLSSQIINIIIVEITKKLPFDISDYIIFSSLCEISSAETI